MVTSYTYDRYYINNCNLQNFEFPEKLDKIKDICAMFKYLFFLLFNEDSLETSKESLHAEYLNFWLNCQLKKNKIPLTVANDFYSKIKNIGSLFDEKNKLSSKIYEINEDQFQYMSLLYDLYGNYKNIISLMDGKQKEKTCSYYADEYIKLYGKIIQNCLPQNNSSLCSALDAINKQYEHIKDVHNFFICEITELPSLPSYRYNSIEERTSEDAIVQLRQETQDSVDDNDTRYLSSVFGFTGTILGILFTLLILYKVNKNFT